jgi:hypothetical protein
MRAGGMMRGAVGRPVLYNPQPQRELISVPVTDQIQNYPAAYKHNRQTAETNNYVPNAEVKHTIFISFIILKLLSLNPLISKDIHLCLQ